MQADGRNSTRIIIQDINWRGFPKFEVHFCNHKWDCVSVPIYGENRCICHVISECNSKWIIFSHGSEKPLCSLVGSSIRCLFGNWCHSTLPAIHIWGKTLSLWAFVLYAKKVFWIWVRNSVYYLGLHILEDPCSLKYHGTPKEISCCDEFEVGQYATVWEAMVFAVSLLYQ